MICLLVQQRDRVFLIGYGFLSLLKNMIKNVGRKIYKNLSSN